MKILAVDLGGARTGLAVCDEKEKMAFPAGVITERDRNRLADAVAGQAKEHDVRRIVVGLPRNMDGTEGQSAQNARAFADKLKERISLPVDMWDERGTTLTAHNLLNDTDTRGKKRKAVVDAVAATVILQGYLDYRRNSRRDG